MSKEQSPANAEETFVVPADFIPMSMPKERLSVPDRPGWHRHWFRGSPDRLARAQEAYYQFVDPATIHTANFDVAGDGSQAGNTDMGTRYSVVAGDDLDNSGQPSRLYLMECRQELFELSQKLLADRNESIATALRGGQIGAMEGDGGETAFDASQRYVKGKVPDLFNPRKKPRAS
jgi:hypothetical protein